MSISDVFMHRSSGVPFSLVPPDFPSSPTPPDSNVPIISNIRRPMSVAEFISSSANNAPTLSSNIASTSNG